MLAVAAGDDEAKAELADIDGIGPKLVEAIAEFFAEAHNLDAWTIWRARSRSSHRPHPRPAARPSPARPSSSPAASRQMTRAEAKALAEKLWGQGRGLRLEEDRLVVLGADAGSKAKKAAELGVATLDEAAWLERAGVLKRVCISAEGWPSAMVRVMSVVPSGYWPPESTR
jgi:DNA ligase (NAD+)